MIKIGFSKDVHPLEEGRPFVLGGIKIDHHKGSVGHSDGDCLLHAIAEAILGALALGDLGKFFPDTEPKYKDYDSQLILKEVFEFVYNRGYEISNLDCMISLERPKLAPYMKEMRENIASILKCDKGQISIKATTHEGLGFVGREEGILCEAIVLLEGSDYGID
ncbi:MAG: 2-C-methyl-D-erythritol 2,4-cyclodiphosphate synthase [Bacilli bacterium]|nr:2-C-methyl-D-erythritol 2,4-cyclodiphosphate synthase [Bacilli bacterium]